MAVKRTNGEGSIRKKTVKGNLYWEGRYTDSDGKQRSVSGKTQSEVRDKLRAASVLVEKSKREKQAIASGKVYYDKDITLNEWHNIYIDKFSGNLKPQSIVRQELCYKRHFEDSIGNEKIRYITEEDLLDLIRNMKNCGLSNNSIKSYFGMLSKFFNKAVSKGIINSNPAKGLAIKNIDAKNPKRALTDKEINLFLETISKERKYLVPFFTFLINTGCRVGEAISLEWKDIEKDMRFCEITKTRVRYKNVNKDSTPKNNSSKRKVPLNDTVSDMLKALKKEQKDMGIFNPDNKVFLSKNNKIMEATLVAKQTKSICKTIRKEHNIEFPDVTPHWFRHTFASHGIASNIPILYLQKICGWSNPNMLLKIYGHMNEEQALNAVNNIYNTKNN